MVLSNGSGGAAAGAAAAGAGSVGGAYSEHLGQGKSFVRTLPAMKCFIRKGKPMRATVSSKPQSRD